MDRKLVVGVAVALILVVTAAVLVIVALNAPPKSPSPLFTVTGKQENMQALSGQVVSWNFTFAYNGTKALQNVNLYLNNGGTPFKTVPEVTASWTYNYIWTPSDIAANTTITIAWQGGTEQYAFQPNLS